MRAIKNKTKTTAAALIVAMVTGLAGGSATFYAPPARAITVVCVNCSTVWNQMMEYAKEVETALNTAQQLQTQIQQYNNMVQQGLSLPDSMFGSITSSFNQLRGIYSQGTSLAYSMSNLDSKFRDQFKGYDSYLQSIGAGTSNMPGQYKKWSDAGFDNARSAMEAVGMNTSSFATEDAMLSSLVQRSASAQGRMQAIQAGNEIAAQQVQQLQKLREMIAANVTLQSNYIAQQTERQAIGDAANAQFYSRKSTRGPSEGF